VRELGKFFSLSFLWGFFQWFYTAGDNCGFASFPSLGLKAYEYKYIYIYQCCIFRSVPAGTDGKSRTGMQTGTRHPHVPPRPKFLPVSARFGRFGLFRPVYVIRPEYFFGFLFLFFSLFWVFFDLSGSPPPAAASSFKLSTTSQPPPAPPSSLVSGQFLIFQTASQSLLHGGGFIL
jgi:hypothetical protein